MCPVRALKQLLARGTPLYNATLIMVDIKPLTERKLRHQLAQLN